MLNWLLKNITKLTVAGGRYKNDQNWGYVKRAQSKGVRTIIHNLVHEVSMSLNNLQRSRAKRPTFTIRCRFAVSTHRRSR